MSDLPKLLAISFFLALLVTIFENPVEADPNAGSHTSLMYQP